MATPFMMLVLPTPTVTLGPEYAQLLNAAIESVDEHDHSSGKGVKVKPNGIDINSDMDIQDHQLLNIKTAQMSTSASTLSGPTNVLKLHSVGGDLWYTNGNGTPVQLSSGAVVASTPGVAQIFLPRSITSNTTILPTDAEVYLLINTTTPKSITLPQASSLAAGRTYMLKDVNGLSKTNPISILTQGIDTIDGDLTYSIDVDYACIVLVTDGANKWYIS